MTTTTPEPVYDNSRPLTYRVIGDDLKMEPHVKLKLHSAAHYAIKLYPGPVGETLSKEILTWAEIGMRIAGHGPTMKLVDEILKTPLPSTKEAA